MSDKTEAEVVAYLAQQGTSAREIAAGAVYTFSNGDGGLVVQDTDGYAPAPRRTTAARKVSSAESFVAYLAKHALPQTEVYADVKNSSIVAVIDSHEGAGLPGGWQGHKVTLVLEHTKSWLEWMQHDKTWFTQSDFAEFIEQRATDVSKPVAGDLMSLAQNFYMTKGLEFESSERLDNGETNLVYKEKVTTKGLGKLEVPKDLELVLQPYIDSPRQFAFANFRTRLNGSQLLIGYVLVRPEEILDGIFADIVKEIREGRKASDDGSVTAFDGIEAPIFYGRPQ